MNPSINIGLSCGRWRKLYTLILRVKQVGRWRRVPMSSSEFLSLLLPEPVQWGRVFLSEPVMPDPCQQTNHEWTSYFLLLFLFLCSMALSSPASWAQLFVFSPSAVNMVPWLTLLFFLLKEAAPTSPAFVSVWPQPISGFRSLLPHLCWQLEGSPICCTRKSLSQEADHGAIWGRSF